MKNDTHTNARARTCTHMYRQMRRYTENGALQELLSAGCYMQSAVQDITTSNRGYQLHRIAYAKQQDEDAVPSEDTAYTTTDS